MSARRSTWFVVAASTFVCWICAGDPAIAVTTPPARGVVAHIQNQRPTATGDVSASIPYAALSPVDGLPTALVRGRSYIVNIPVWVASNGATGVASVYFGDASCRRDVRPGTTVRLTCAFTVRKAGPMSITAAVRLADGASASQTYHHTA